MARVPQRRQDVPRLTWWSSSPVRPLPDCNASSAVHLRHLRPATFTMMDSGTRVAE